MYRYHIFIICSSAEEHLGSSLFQDRASTPKWPEPSDRLEVGYKSLGPDTMPGSSEVPFQSRTRCGAHVNTTCCALDSLTW